MGGQGFLLLIGLKDLITMTTLKTLFVDAEGLLMLMGLKLLIKMTRQQNSALLS